MRSRWTEHEGQRIFLVDLSDLGNDVGAVEAELAVVSEGMGQERKDSVLGLVDLRGTTLSREVALMIKNAAPRTGSAIRRAAIVLDQVTGIRRLIMEGILRVARRDATLFDDPEGAKEWLIHGG
jgi:hypothetical protein